MRNGIGGTLGNELAAKEARVKRWMYYCAGISLGCVLGGEVLRAVGQTPGALASAIGAVSIYSFGAFVFLYIWRRDLKRQIRLLANEMDAGLTGDEHQEMGETRAKPNGIDDPRDT